MGACAQRDHLACLGCGGSREMAANGPQHGASACRGARFVRMPTARSQAPL
ncbi:hypothetical protein XMIN_1791 [Xanthomonas citri pv. mangiferaeindicae LMG 941]|nr:hypothetical protein XMIN_1791 [Xanthomonas citri pv. mangiferaeindicae LMG 941]